MKQTQDNVKRSLLRTAGLISFLTVISRVSGLIRDMVSAHIFGLSRVWDAFVYAFMVPNLLRRLVGEGALSSAFIPVYTEVLNREGKEAAERVAHIVFSMLILGLGTLLLLVHLILKLIIIFVPLSDKVFLALQLLMILFPYIFFLSLVALFMGILHSHKKFFIPAFTPFLLNLIWIVALFFFIGPRDISLHAKAAYLAWGVLSAGAIQCLVNVIALGKERISLRFLFDFKHPALVKIINLMIPAALGFSITQLNIFVDLNLAMFLGDGANSALWYGNRLMQFPLGVFGIAMGTALLPTISHQVAQDNIEGLKTSLSFSLRSVFLIVIPASIGLIVLREPIIQLCFERGEFTHAGTQRTAFTLLFYCLGLFAYSGIKLVVSAFYSLQDTKTPVKVGALCMVLNIVCNLIFMQFFKEAGLALATALSSTCNFILLMVLLKKKIGSFGELHICLSFMRISFLSVIMGFVAWLVFPYCLFSFSEHNSLELFVQVMITISVSVLSYAVIGLLLRIPEMHRLVYLMLKKVRHS